MCILSHDIITNLLKVCFHLCNLSCNIIFSYMIKWRTVIIAFEMLPDFRVNKIFRSSAGTELIGKNPIRPPFWAVPACENLFANCSKSFPFERSFLILLANLMVLSFPRIENGIITKKFTLDVLVSVMKMR